MLQFTGLGRLTKDPEMKYLPSGTPLTHFTLACDTGFGDKKVTAWLRISVFGKQAEICNQYLAKGKAIVFTAEYSPDKETGNPRTFDGNNGTVAILEAKLLTFEFAGGGQKKEVQEESEDLPEFMMGDE